MNQLILNTHNFVIEFCEHSYSEDQHNLPMLCVTRKYNFQHFQYPKIFICTFEYPLILNTLKFEDS